VFKLDVDAGGNGEAMREAASETITHPK
jgi:hypothetical protein